MIFSVDKNNSSSAFNSFFHAVRRAKQTSANDTPIVQEPYQSYITELEDIFKHDAPPSTKMFESYRRCLQRIYGHCLNGCDKKLALTVQEHLRQTTSIYKKYNIYVNKISYSTILMTKGEIVALLPGLLSEIRQYARSQSLKTLQNGDLINSNNYFTKLLNNENIDSSFHCIEEVLGDANSKCNREVVAKDTHTNDSNNYRLTTPITTIYDNTADGIRSETVAQNSICIESQLITAPGKQSISKSIIEDVIEQKPLYNAELCAKRTVAMTVMSFLFDRIASEEDRRQQYKQVWEGERNVLKDQVNSLNYKFQHVMRENYVTEEQLKTVSQELLLLKSQLSALEKKGGKSLTLPQRRNSKTAKPINELRIYIQAHGSSCHRLLFDFAEGILAVVDHINNMKWLEEHLDEIRRFIYTTPYACGLLVQHQSLDLQGFHLIIDAQYIAHTQLAETGISVIIPVQGDKFNPAYHSCGEHDLVWVNNDLLLDNTVHSVLMIGFYKQRTDNVLQKARVRRYVFENEAISQDNGGNKSDSAIIKVVIPDERAKEGEVLPFTWDDDDSLADAANPRDKTSWSR